MLEQQPAIEPAPWFSLSRSAFWKVAGVLVGVQVATGLLAVTLSAWFAFEQSLDLVVNSLEYRMDALAEEVEERGGTFPDGLAGLSPSLVQDLTNRFPDPIHLIDTEGLVIRTIQPTPTRSPSRTQQLVVTLPERMKDRLEQGEILVRVDRTAAGGTWAFAPIFGPSGRLVGGLVVQPLDNSIDEELRGAQSAFVLSLLVVSGFSGLIAVLLGALFTWRLVQPLRNIMQQVERIGAGDYSARIETRNEDELGRLAAAINQMAAEIEHSVEALRNTDKLRRQLIANVGHDLRTPLAALLGYIEESNRHLGNGEEVMAREALVTAERQGKYLKQLIGDLFELSLLDSAPAPLRREPIPLAELLTDAANTHRPALKKDEIDFEVDLPPALPIIEADGVRLLRLLDNLLVNARHHTPAGGRMWLRARMDDESVWISVEDTGSGMEPDVLAHIFDRYYSGTGPRTRGGRGTGLGLPISWAIARAHGGNLTADSTPGQGSIFTLTLPLNPTEVTTDGMV